MYVCSDTVISLLLVAMRLETSVRVFQAPVDHKVPYCQLPVFSTVSISLTQDQNSLCSATELICSFANLHFVHFDKFTDGFGFSPLTTNYISQHPDYEEVDEEGLYKLRITQAERYNGTRYRCRGYLEGLSQLFFSNEWKLIVTCELNQISCAFNNCSVQQYGCHYTDSIV